MIERFSDPRDLLAAVDGEIESDAAHAMAMGFVHGSIDAGVGGAFFATARDSGGALQLLVVRTMPTRVVVEEVGDARVSDATLDAAVRALDASGSAPENVLVTEPLSSRFIEHWLDVSATQVRRSVGMRLHRLTRVRPPRPVPGRLRLATADDLELALDWSNGYMVDIGYKAASAPPPTAMPPLERGTLYLWEEGGVPQSMAAWSRPTPHACAINWVYTPPALRGRGLASAVVAALSQLVLDGLPGHPPRRSVNLMTDLSNPTSNRIYAALGYEPVRDFTSYDLE